MRNLKKILALVLAMVMTFSVMATANAFTDDAAIDADYEEAIDVLAALGVFEGYENGSFQPKGAITRAEVAAIIYRIATTDVNDLQVKLYSDYNKFDDVNSKSWFAGYVNYCANAEYIRGYNDTTFGPQDNVTGYQVLAMILRAVGYDQNKEWTGAGWEIRVASTAKALGITDTLTGVALGQPATREVVAEILFQTLLKADVKIWTPALGYYLSTNVTLGVDNFDLKFVGADSDDWGRPGEAWTFNVNAKYLFRQDKAVYTFYDEMTECDLSHAIGLKKANTFTAHINGDADAAEWIVQPTDRTNTIGAQGRAIEVYETGDIDTMVVIDTFYATVDSVSARTYDLAGHVITPATMNVTVYDDAATIPYTFVSYTKDYSYTKGDTLAVNWNAGEFAGTASYYEVVSELAPATVTVSAVTKDGYNNFVGFIANGTRYAYNCTYYGEVLGLTAIGSTYKVWTDARGNVLHLELVTDAGKTGYGVVTAVDVERVGMGKYVVVANVLQADNSTATVKFVKLDGSFYATETEAESTALWLSTQGLVSYSGYVDGYYKVCTVAPAAALTDADIECGEVKAINDVDLVNDNTVFYIANYTFSNAKQEYVFTGYSIVKGFKNIMDLQAKDSTIAVQVLRSGEFANAVLVTGANLKVVPEKTPVVNYAYLMTSGQFVDVSDDAWTYSAIINGAAGQSLVVTTAATNANVGATGLYEYTKETHNTVDNVVASANKAAAGSYSVPKAGVMTIAGEKYTVADNCQYFIINNTTGASTGATVDALAQYAAKNEIAYQYDANGYISLIYIIEVNAAYGNW